MEPSALPSSANLVYGLLQVLIGTRLDLTLIKARLPIERFGVGLIEGPTAAGLPASRIELRFDHQPVLEYQWQALSSRWLLRILSRKELSRLSELLLSLFFGEVGRRIGLPENQQLVERLVIDKAGRVYFSISRTAAIRQLEELARRNHVYLLGPADTPVKTCATFTRYCAECDCVQLASGRRCHRIELSALLFSASNLILP